MVVKERQEADLKHFYETVLKDEEVQTDQKQFRNDEGAQCEIINENMFEVQKMRMEELKNQMKANRKT